MATELAGLSWNPVSDLHQLTEFPFMVQRARGRHDRRRDGRRDRLVHGAAPPDLRRPHALGHRLPRRRRRHARRPALRARLLRRLQRSGRSCSSQVGRSGAGSRQQRVGGDRHRAGVRPRPRLPLRQPLRRPARRASSRCSSAPSSESPPTRCTTLLWIAVAALAAPRRDRPAAAVRLGRRRGRPRGGRADRCARAGLPPAARAGRGGDGRDHRRAAGLRPARHPGGHRAADHLPARVGAWRSRWRSPSPSPGSDSRSPTSRPTRSASG